MRIILLSLLFFATLWLGAIAQGTQLSLHLNTGIEQYAEVGALSPNTTFEEQLRPFASLGVSAQFFFDDAYYCRAGLLANRSHRTYSRFINTSGSFAQYSVELIRDRQAYFFTSPLAFGQRVNRFYFEVGLQLLYMAHIDNSESARLVTLFEGDEPVYTEYEEEDYESFYWEPFVAAGLAISDQFRLQLSVFYNNQGTAYTSIYPKWRFTAGLGYRFY